jgi:FAD/FMN-containing dehydrogenase
MNIEGAIFRRGDAGYEEARQAATWNFRKPERYPEVVVQAVSEADVVEAVRYAAAHDLKVKARGGGHSWTASSIRDDGMLIDLSRLDGVRFDEERGLAVAQAGAKGRELNTMLADHGLFFPSGHCPTVGIGGFLLQGGWGWNSRALGPACLSVMGIDVVTAEGELIHADEETNSDWLWAARGSGAGFFGVVTRFYLRCHPRPTATFTRTDVYPLEVAEEVLRWALEAEPTLPAELEFAIMITRPTLPDGRTVHHEPGLMIMAMALMMDDDEAIAALNALDGCPVLDQAVHREEPTRRTFVELYDLPDSVEPEGFRWAADGMWTDVGADELVPAAISIARDLPTDAAHVFWMPWRVQDFGDAAISVQGELYLAAFAGWTDPADDERMVAWPTEHMRRLEPLSNGIQLADENLVNRPARFLVDEHTARLEALRAQHDPNGRFHSYLLPTPST